MTPEYATELLKTAMLHAVGLAAPILLTAMVIGLAVSLFQAVTTIHEQTLTFVPKIVGIAAVLFFLLPWMLRTLIQFALGVIQKIPDMVR